MKREREREEERMNSHELDLNTDSEMDTFSLVHIGCNFSLEMNRDSNLFSLLFLP